MKKWLIFGVCLVFVAAIGWWVWSLGMLQPPVVPRVTLRVDAQPVQIRRGAQSDWSDGKTGDELSVGDSVRTGVKGSAALEILDTGESRLAEQSQITVQSAQSPALNGSPLLVNLALDSGRIWSRVLRLFDVQSTYEVHTDTVVATVRGTAFDLNKAATGTVLWVSDSAVQVSGSEEGSLAPSPDSQFAVSEGFMARFDQQGKLLSSEAINDASKQTDWFIANTTHDGAFVRASADAVQAHFAGMHSQTPGSLLDGVQKLSENIHLALAGNGAPVIYARYAARRLAAIKALMDQGSPGAALQAYSSEEEDISAHANGPHGAEYRNAIRQELIPVFMLMQDVVPSSGSYRLKQRLEDLNVTLAGTDDLETAYARLLAIDARLDEASALIGMSSLDDARGLLDTARQGIANVERDIDHLPDDASPDRLNAVRAKLYALKARETSIRTRLATAIEPPTSQFPSTDTSATSTSSTLVTVPSPTSTDQVPTSTVRLQLAAVPSNPTAGDQARLTASLIDATGSTSDVTAKTLFSLTGNVASLNGPVLSTRSAGTVVVQGSYALDGQPISATLTLSIKAKAPVLQSLTVVAQGATVLAWNQTVPIIVRAQYSDGTQKDVTTSAQLTSSNTVLGYFTGSLFHAGATAVGTDSVIATYKEGSVTKTSSLDIEIVSR